MAFIFPKAGQEQQIAQRLLALATNVRDVGTSTDSGFAFVVPDDLYERYLAVDEVVGDEQPDTPDIPRRRPGRPRKAAPPKEGD